MKNEKSLPPSLVIIIFFLFLFGFFSSIESTYAHMSRDIKLKLKIMLYCK